VNAVFSIESYFYLRKKKQRHFTFVSWKKITLWFLNSHYFFHPLIHVRRFHFFFYHREQLYKKGYRCFSTHFVRQFEQKNKLNSFAKKKKVRGGGVLNKAFSKIIFMKKKKNVERWNTISNYQKNSLSPTTRVSRKKKQTWHAGFSPIVVSPPSRNV